MKIATWNVNGIRKRQTELQDWLDRVQPDVVCLQEIKATIDQLPVWLCEIEGYWCYWHGGKGYSGVGLHVSKRLAAAAGIRTPSVRLREPHRPRCGFPPSRSCLFTCRTAGRTFRRRCKFLEALEQFASDPRADTNPIVICGDLNIARADIDVHPKERKPRAIGQLPEERAQLERIIGHGLVDVSRTLEPDNDQMFTWWAPWRNMRQRNIGWRLDYLLASQRLFERVRSCTIERETGTSDHAPVVGEFEI